MITKKEIQPTTQESSLSTEKNNSNITASSAPSRANSSSYQTTASIPNITILSREINQKPFEFAATYSTQTEGNMKKAIQNLLDLNQLSEDQTVAENTNPEEIYWKIFVQKGTLFWLFMLMKVTIMMPVFKDQ